MLADGRKALTARCRESLKLPAEFGSHRLVPLKELAHACDPPGEARRGARNIANLPGGEKYGLKEEAPAKVADRGFPTKGVVAGTQLDDTYVEDANLLMAWYSGWFNGLSKKHYMDVVGAKVVQDQVISYCEANPQKLVIDGIATVVKVDRAILGIQQ